MRKKNKDFTAKLKTGQRTPPLPHLPTAFAPLPIKTVYASASSHLTHKVDSKALSGNEPGYRRLIAISCSASLIESGSPSCSDSNIASGRTGRRKELLSVLRMAVRVFPCGMGGSVFITTPLVALVRRPRLRRLQRKLRPIAPSRVTGGCFCLRGSYGVCAVIGLPALTPCRLPLWVCLYPAGHAAFSLCG